MTTFVGKTGSSVRKYAGQAAGVAAAIIATATLIGWWIGLPMLSSWGSSFAAMKPVAARCFGALGLALVYPGKILLLRICGRPRGAPHRRGRSWPGVVRSRFRHWQLGDVGDRRGGTKGLPNATRNVAGTSHLPAAHSRSAVLSGIPSEVAQPTCFGASRRRE